MTSIVIDDGYSRNASFACNVIFTFLMENKTIVDMYNYSNDSFFSDGFYWGSLYSNLSILSNVL